MRLNHKMKSLGTLVLGLVLLAPIGYAQSGRDDRDWRDQDSRDWRNDGRNSGNYAVNRGYQDGIRQGQFDRSRTGTRNGSGNYRNRDWQRADRGYEKSMGAKGQYKQAYRDGYERGYQEGFSGRSANGGWNDGERGRRGSRDGYPNNGYPNNGYPGGYSGSALTQAAQQNGWQDGAYYAQMDRRNGSAANATGAKGYRDADHGYTSSLGSKNEFQQIYRDAFIRGYQQEYGNSGYNTGYPGNGGYNQNALGQAAQQNGLQSGAHYAQLDRNQGNAYNPTGAKGYRDADQGYTDSLGSKSDFQRIFRENFVRGYQQAYGNAGYRR